MSVTDPAGSSSPPMEDIDRLLPTSMGIPSVRHAAYADVGTE
ncbi:hypothetical protein [Halovenus halobia]